MKSLIYSNKIIGLVTIMMIHSISFAVTTVPLNNFSCETSLCIPVLPDGEFSQMAVPNTFNFSSSNSNSLFFRTNFTNAGSQCFKAEINLNCAFNYAIYGPFQTQNDLNICADLNGFLLTPLRTGLISNGISFEPFLSSDYSGMYLIHIIPVNCTSGEVNFRNWEFSNCFKTCGALDCDDCVISFQPSPGTYLVSAWVKENYTGNQPLTYSNTRISISFLGDPALFHLTPSGQIIDGWQRIEGVIEIPENATDILIDFVALQIGVNCFFDDIRFFPYEGSMLSYVYDPYTLRLMAQLDDRNYATFYEYDEEGHLIRIKKETERGIMTIEENRTNIRRRVLD
jgi:hypothetical protein